MAERDKSWLRLKTNGLITFSLVKVWRITVKSLIKILHLSAVQFCADEKVETSMERLMSSNLLHCKASCAINNSTREHNIHRYWLLFPLYCFGIVRVTELATNLCRYLLLIYMSTLLFLNVHFTLFYN